MLARQFFLIVALVWAVTLGLASNVQAYDESTIFKAEADAQSLQQELRRLTTLPNNFGTSDEAIAQQRQALEAVRAKALAASDVAAGPLGEVTTQVEKLGPKPPDGQQETDVIAQKRRQLDAQLARLGAVQKQYTLINVEAQQAQSRLIQTQRSQFLQRIFKPDLSILAPQLWLRTFTGSVDFWQTLTVKLRSSMQNNFSLIDYRYLTILPMGLLIFWLVGSMVIPRLAGLMGFAHSLVNHESGLLRLWRVVWGVGFLIVTAYLVILLSLISFESAGLLTAELKQFVEFLSRGLMPAVVQGGIAYFVTAPRHPERRLVAIDTHAARLLTVIVVLASLVYGFGEEISKLAGTFNLPVSFAIGQSALSSVLLIGLIGLGLVIVKRQAAQNDEQSDKHYYLAWFMRLMPLLWLLLAIAVLALVFGFIALAYFIAGNLLTTAILVVVFGILHAFADALAKSMLTAQTRPGKFIRSITGWSEQSVNRLVLIFRSIADAILVLLGVLSLVALWTVVLFDLKDVLTSTSQGIKLGNITLSPSALAMAFLVLAIGIFATRYFTRWLDRRVLAETHLDKGVQNSLRAAAGYSGYTLATAFALSAAGVEFSNLAIVAGALGVGIGFGLQSIVNNFVSGLILLAERPVRVGDWVATNDGEGIVKKINVRSTEIETFDSCTIIVPNSNLITQAVRNWTHRDTVGRFNVSVIFNHKADSDILMKQLQDILSEHPKIMRHPAPLVQLSKISTLGLEFDLRAHALDVFDAPQIASEIRLSIARLVSRDLLSSTLPPAVKEELAEMRKVKKP